ncbi:hypothetical protein TP70_01530 [Staphylococcus microti]|uniref:Accessory Sec system protein Asp1 n=3 Tax=Staphylococcus TaxID=1279 RepID=A0A0D6XS00_9STAP|nr:MULTISPECIES: accessory Sec system protein Asp1 [Staphylococcus]KIX91594.1 hypothetical protein TP70_01530 [Staphylococcus microti]PNZ83039.1 accessory Sec system protein Asp1 [Staphylococcus microti]SUN02174.1 accessory Sec system protein Asp1 [Staphylococcus microti]
MKYFIPAWYPEQHWWQNRADQQATAFDDMISLMSMHHQNEQPFQLLVLNYTPNLRTFLHRYELFDAAYWSVFDEIQGFTHQTPQAVDYRQLDWPEGTEFLYLPSMIRALMPDDMHADIYFSQDGYMSRIAVFQSAVQQYCYIIDDRGYVSQIAYYDEQGTTTKQQYLTQEGDWILEVQLSDGKVRVNPQYQTHFVESYYPSMEAVIKEYLIHYRDQEMAQPDAIVIAADVCHNAMLADIFSANKRCYSVFQQRLQASDAQFETLDREASWLVDTLENEQRLITYRATKQLSNRLMRITPFDAQMLPNISSQLHETYIGLWVDGLEDTRLADSLAQLVDYIREDTSLRIVLLSKRHQYLLPQWLKQNVATINEQMNVSEKVSEAERELMKEDEPIDYVEIKSVPFEVDIIEALSTLRIVIDLSHEPDLFLQISCLSAGIPQINMRTTDYVVHEMNGHVLENDTTLQEALDYYLIKLKNWNQSYAYAMKLAKKYASDKIIVQLDALIEGENHGA